MIHDPNLLAKIRKLLALGQSPNEHEAMVALAMASSLMEKHQISMSAVDVAAVGKSGMERELYTVEGLRMKYMWVVTLGNAAAALYDGTVLLHNGLHGTSFFFVGTPGDIPLMKSTFEYLYQSQSSIAAADLVSAKAQSPYPFRPKDTMKFKLGHGQAFAQRVYARAKELANLRKAAVSSFSTGTALVVLKDRMLADWKVQNKIRTVNLKQSAGSAAGSRYGDAAGRAIPLGGSIGNTRAIGRG
jgi:hypothetical protein